MYNMNERRSVEITWISDDEHSEWMKDTLQ